MAPEISPPGQIRDMVMDLVKETVADYLNSEEGRGLLIQVLAELENDAGHWIIVTPGEPGEGAGHD